jgi:hypothetical protein
MENKSIIIIRPGFKKNVECFFYGIRIQINKALLKIKKQKLTSESDKQKLNTCRVRLDPTAWQKECEKKGHYYNPPKINETHPLFIEFTRLTKNNNFTKKIEKKLKNFRSKILNQEAQNITDKEYREISLIRTYVENFLFRSKYQKNLDKLTAQVTNIEQRLKKLQNNISFF